jgi:hypothetical protein
MFHVLSLPLCTNFLLDFAIVPSLTTKVFCLKVRMATSGDILCAICEAQHITKHADHWCPECDEGLCAVCENHHKISRGTRYHGIISIENYKKLPSKVFCVFPFIIYLPVIM